MVSQQADQGWRNRENEENKELFTYIYMKMISLLALLNSVPYFNSIQVFPHAIKKVLTFSLVICEV
jgi:hypothetical protein